MSKRAGVTASRGRWPVLIAALAMCVLSPARGDAGLTVVLTRHAEKMLSADPDPPLSSAGHERAALLASMLSRGGVTAIYASDARRTRETAQPLATLMGMAMHQVAADKTPELVQAIRKHTAGVVLVVGHSNTVPDIISALGGPAVKIEENEFDALFMVTMSGSEVSVVRLRYGVDLANRFSSTKPAHMANRRSRIMQIKFVRSGGMAAMPGLNVEGTVDLSDRAPKVTSNAGKYERALTPREIEQLRNAAGPAQGSAARTALASRSRVVPETHQYEITVATEDGKSHQLTFNSTGGADVDQVVPGVGDLVRWIDAEAQRIKEHLMTHR